MATEVTKYECDGCWTLFDTLAEAESCEEYGCPPNAQPPNGSVIGGTVVGETMGALAGAGMGLLGRMREALRG
jgi:hypothetical protein